MSMFHKKEVSHTPPLYLYNTLSKTKEAFVPKAPPLVTMYSCGPTVYDFAHIGNLRSYVFADTLKRTLIHNGYTVIHTINITDFGHLSSDGDDGDDKMVIALKREGKPHTMQAVQEIADRFTDAFKSDMQALGIIPPTHYTRASAFIQEEIALVKVLQEKGYTYETSDGVYFDISRFPTYGKLGNINLQALKDGARVETNPEKKHPADFAVWKKGELGWDSLWGKGFPGWHIECTAMAFATLGKQIDIHTGGIDHIATHHNGEIAQAEAATGKAPFVHYWMHNAFITIEHTKISKSLGNSLYLRHLTDRGYHPLVYRYWLLTGHYRSPMNFTFEALDGAKQAHYRLRRHVYEELGTIASTPSAAYMQQCTDALNDDLNTATVIALLWEIIKDKKLSKEEKLATIRAFDTVLAIGLSEEKTDTPLSLPLISLSELPEEVQTLLEERKQARAEKRWDDADMLRAQINLHGYLVEDSPEGMKVTKSG